MDGEKAVSYCRVIDDDYPTDNCSSTTFSTSGANYQRVCGRAIKGYQKRWSNAFWIGTHKIQMATMLMDYQSLVVIYNTTSGHFPMDYLTTAAPIIVHVHLVLSILLLPL